MSRLSTDASCSKRRATTSGNLRTTPARIRGTNCATCKSGASELHESVQAFCAPVAYSRTRVETRRCSVDAPAQLRLGKRRRATCTPHRINTQYANVRPCARKAVQARCEAVGRETRLPEVRAIQHPNAQTPEPHDPALSRRSHFLRSLPGSRARDAPAGPETSERSVEPPRVRFSFTLRPSDS